MYDIIIYLLQSGACLAGFYFVYKLFLSRETLHRFNRMLLLSVIVVSAVLPLCRITVERELSVATTDTAIEVSEIASAEIVKEERSFDYETTICIVFLLGAAATAARLIFSIASVRRIIASGTTTTTDDGISLTIMDGDTKPFSWMRHIVLSAKDAEENGRIIIAHETAHIRLHHSWDILAVDIIGCVQWFNPALWLLRRELQSLHEYEADDAVLASGVNIKEYQMLLIKKAVGGRLLTIANCLNHSKLKNRITMMLQKPSSRWSAGKALLMLPLVGLSLGAFARTVYVLPQEQDKVMQNSSNDQIAKVENPADTLKGKVIRIAGKTAPQTKGEIRTVTITGSNAEPSETTVYIDGQKVDSDALKNVDSQSVASVTVLKGKSAEDAGYESKGDNHKVIVISTKDGATTVENGESKTVQTTTVITDKSSDKTIVINGNSKYEAKRLNGAKLILDGKQITAEELGKVDSSQIDNIVVNKSSGENVIRITTKQFDPMEYSQLENAEIRVDGKTVKVGGKPIKASSLRIIPAQNNIANINIDKRDDKTVVDIRTKDGKGLKKQKTKRRK
ncbi:MAG: M56 family peptidase [Alistipes sp.]|nr:M56 family peptidase [Alistipes sp.]